MKIYIILKRWFNTLNKHFKVDGRPSFFYKPVEPNRTIGLTSKMALERLQTLLKSKNHAFIYHCYNHYFCPIGFELEPKCQESVYQNNTSTSEAGNEFTEWLFVAETSRKYPGLHCFKWEDVERDLTTRSPDFLNIRKLDKGIQTKAERSRTDIDESITPLADNDRPPRVKKEGRNLHCLIMFQSFDSKLHELAEASSDLNDDADSKNLDNITEENVDSDSE